MGTVYKIRQEVKDFIISTRKEHHSFSCRILAELVADKFHITISKSYVNTILKKAKLNGPLGRKIAARRNVRRFIIPKEKKEQIFRTIQQIEVTTKSNEDEIKKENFIQKDIEIKKDDKDIETIEKINQDIPEDIFISIKTARTKRINLRGGPFNRMGTVFLKAAEWAVTEYSILGKIILRYIQEKKRGNYWDGLFNRVMQNIYRESRIFDSVCILPRYLDKKEELYVGAICGVLMAYGDTLNKKAFSRLADYGLYTLNGIQEEVDIASFVVWLRQQIIEETFIIEYLKEKDNFFKDIAGIQINLYSGEKIFLDSNRELKGILKKEEIMKSQPIKQALSMVSKQIIVNTEPAVFYSKIQDEDDYKRFYNIISAFENISGNGIQSIVLYDNDRQMLVDFDIIPKIKRKFILGVSWIDKGYSPLLSTYSADKQKVVYLESINKVIWFYEDIQDITVSKKKDKIRVRRIYIDKYDDFEDKMIIITNDINNRVDKIIDKCFSAMLMYNNRENINIERERKQVGDNRKIKKNSCFFNSSLENISLWDMVIDYTNTLIEYSKKEFMANQLYNNRNILQSWLDFPGFVYEGNQYLSIILLPPEDYQYIDYLNLAVQEVNSRDIYDFYGRRLYIDIEK